MFGSLIRQPARLLSLGGAAPAFTLTSASGQQVNALQAAAHHNLVIQFFDTICDTCRSQASQLCRLAVEHSSDVFVGVDAAPEDASALLGYAQRYQPQPCPVALFPDPGLKVSQAYRAAVVPTLYVVDSGGKIAYAAVGTAGVNELPATLQRLGG